MRASALPALVVLVAAAGCEIRPTNPIDPATDPVAQKRATLSGRVRAVLGPNADGSVPAAGFCDDVDGGDHSGFTLVLRGLADTGAGIDVQSAQTNEGGAYSFVDVPAGEYVLEVRRDGFALPADVALSLAVGDTRTVETLCAVRTAPPPAPLVVAPPALVDGENRAPGASAAAALDIDVDAGARARVQESKDGVVVRDEIVSTDAPVPLVLDATPGVVDDDDVRTTWRVDVFAEDALANRSAPASFVVVKDGRAPAAPVVTVAAGRDRVVVDAVFAAAVDDDAPTSFLYAYAVVAPASDADAACPFGAPGDDDPVVHGAFAVEGRSPVSAPTAEQTLSGLIPGTDLVVLVAGVDAAGNRGCWSAPVAARPDVVTFSGAEGHVIDAVGGTVGLEAGDGFFAIAHGDEGLVVVDRAGASHVVDDLAHDVAIFGDHVVYARGALGVGVVDVDAAGVPGAPRGIALGARAADVIAVGLGHAYVGDSVGVVDVALDGTRTTALALPGSGPVVGLALFGRTLAVARDSAQPTLDVIDLTTNTLLSRTPLAVAPRELVFVDGRIYFSLGALGLGVVDLDGGATAATVRRLAGGAAAVAVAAFDDAVLVADDEGGVHVAQARGGAVRFLGAFAVSGVPVGVTAVVGGACVAAVDDSGSALTCLRTVQGPLVDEERRTAPQTGAVVRVAVDAGRGLMVQDATDGVHNTVFGLDDGAPAGAVDAGGDADGKLLAVAVPNVGFLVGDQLITHDGVVVDVDVSGALAANGLVAPYQGFSALVGDRLVVGVVAQGGVPHAAVLTATVTDDGVDVILADVTVTDLDDRITQITTAVAHNGRVFVGSVPFGLVAVDVDSGAVDDVLAVRDDGFVADVAFGEEGAVVAGAIVVDNVARGRLFPFDGSAIDENGGFAIDPAALRGVTAIADRFAVSTADDGVVVVDAGLRPVLQVPSVAQAGQTQPTARGLLVADAEGGAAFLILR